MCRIEPRFLNAEYRGLIAAPGTPNAQTTPSFSRIRTAASIARIFAISHPLACFRSGTIIRRWSGDLNGIEFLSHQVERLAKSPRSQAIALNSK
jgi:hypothetical protein